MSSGYGTTNDIDVVERFDNVCGRGGDDDVSALQDLADEIGIDTLINARGPDGYIQTPLVIASWLNRQKTARQLIEWGAVANVKDVRGHTALHFAFTTGMVQLLIGMGGAEVNALSEDGKTPLSISCCPGATKALIKEGALVVCGRWNALRHSVTSAHIGNLEILLTHRGFLRALEWIDESGRTPREEAARAQDDEVVAMIDEALILAKDWDRRVAGVCIGLAAADGRATAVIAGEKERSGKGKIHRIEG